LPPRAVTPAPAVRPLPYIFVWLPAAGAHVQCFELLLGWTPEAFEVSAEVFGVPEQPLNFAPPGVTFVAAEADALVLEDALAWVLAEADELSSAFFAWPLFSADAEVSVDADTDTVAVALAESLAA
jgi:hypothetical protein